MAYRGMRGPAGGSGYDSSYLERQNDDQVGLLSDKVASLKRVAISMGDEVREQNKYIDGMGSDFDSNSGLLGGVMGRLRSVSKAGGHKMKLYLIGFSLFVFFIIYYLKK